MADDRDVVPVLKRLISRLEVLGHRGFAEVARESLAEIRRLRAEVEQLKAKGVAAPPCDEGPWGDIIEEIASM